MGRLVAITGEVISPHEGLRLIKEAGAHGVATTSHAASPLAERNQTPSSFFAIQFLYLPCVLLSLLCLQETPARTEKGAGAQKTAHQEAAKRLHALHERDACERGRRVHAEGERRHQSDPGTKGRSNNVCVCTDLFLQLLINHKEITALKTLHVPRPN